MENPILSKGFYRIQRSGLFPKSSLFSSTTVVYDKAENPLGWMRNNRFGALPNWTENERSNPGLLVFWLSPAFLITRRLPFQTVLTQTL